MPTRPPTAAAARNLAAALLETHPLATLLLDRGLRVTLANAAARTLLGATEGAALPELLPCLDPAAPGRCAPGAPCASCAFRGCAEGALAGRPGRARGFVLRSGAAGEPADLHLLASAAPLDHEGGRRAILALDDANAILADPGLVRVCAGCGRVEDEEGGWHPLHRYLEDRLGLEPSALLCDACGAGGGHGERP